jgi:hypothetical protein
LASVKNRFTEIIKDQFNEFYVTLKINDHIECVPFESDRFKNVIRSEYFEEKGQTISDDRLDGILKLIESQMMYNDDIRKVDLSLRIAKTGNDEDDIFYYDLTNQKWEIVRITSEGWDIVKDNTVPIFKRHENNHSLQIHPSNGIGKKAHWDRFLKLFNLETKSDIVLLSVYMISLFVPDIPKVILVLSGNGGGAKTMTFKMKKNIVDPGSADTFSFPKQVNDLVQILSHHHVNFFDNVSSISNEVSDILCRAVSGASFSKRALYTNDSDIIYKFKRCVGVNGINLATTQPDFLDRALVIRLKRIPNDKRKKECDIDREFEELRPFVLGHILDVLVKAIRYKKEHRNEQILKEFPRMADFAEWGEIISRCLGYKDNEYIDAYHENINNQNDEVIESSPVAEALLLFIGEKEDQGYWEGTPTRLHKDLSDIIDQIKPELKRSNLWPKASNKLTFKINEIVPNLKEKGIEIITGEKNSEGNRVIKIRKLQKKNGSAKEILNKVDEELLFNPHIYRQGYSDTFGCDKCPQRGDIHFMKQHMCNSKN